MKARKLVTLLLALVMIVSLFGGVFVVTAADEVMVTPTATYGGEELTMTATGLDEALIDAQGETRKVLIDQKVFIIRGNEVYTIAGQLVK